MMKFVIAFAAAAMAFTSVASAKVPGTKVANPSWSNNQDRSYASSSGSFSFGGGAYTNEIQTNLTSGYFFSGKQCKDCDSGTTISIAGSYLRYLKDNFQVGAEAALNIYSDETSPTNESATTIDLVGVGAYNFSADLKSAFYAKLGVGLYSVRDGNDFKNEFGFFLGGGKRFDWLSNVSYTPELRLTKRGDIDMAVDIAFLNFSILWN